MEQLHLSQRDPLSHFRDWLHLSQRDPELSSCTYPKSILPATPCSIGSSIEQPHPSQRDPQLSSHTFLKRILCLTWGTSCTYLEGILCPTSETSHSYLKGASSVEWPHLSQRDPLSHLGDQLHLSQRDPELSGCTYPKGILSWAATPFSKGSSVSPRRPAAPISKGSWVEWLHLSQRHPQLSSHTFLKGILSHT